MAKRKFYAVKVGKIPGIYSTWDECQLQVDGVSGAKYQGFLTLEEAEKYILQDDDMPETNSSTDKDDYNSKIDKAILDLKENEVIAFVDGSYDEKQEKSAFGAIIFSENNGRNVLYKAFTKNLSKEFIDLRNVSAELEAVKESINWALKYNKSKISIYYDYKGIELWARKEWKANNSITSNYVKFMQEKQSLLDIKFIKVPAHTGIKYNEEVDSIAKNALLAKGHKTYNDGSVYFTGYGVEDWQTIVDFINEENDGLNENEEIAELTMTKETIGNREKIKIIQGRNVVTINCYRNSKSYVQGKSTSLFEKLISTAISCLTEDQTAIEKLNEYHALTINKEEVETKFEQMLPNYKHESKKHYTNLLTAVYNTMLTGYMPDYTCLVTPIFRAYEYYLHKMLGDYMGLDTETDRGTNNFGFFTKNDEGLYECNNRNVSKLNKQQLDYLNKFYTQYNSVRHPYSHWSADDSETAVITDINEARNLLNEGIGLIDQFYTLF